MEYLPGIESIIDETLEVFALANTQFAGNRVEDKLKTHPYVKREIESRSSRLIIEKILAISIKLRFLDDQKNIIKENDRENCGQITDKNGVKEVGLREALNKIIHHKSITLTPRRTRTKVSEDYGNEEGFIKIPPGTYESVSIYVETEGIYWGIPWVFNTELNHLINEIFMILHKTNEKNRQRNS